MKKDYFGQKAGTYETDGNRVSNVDNIANAILERVRLDRGMHVMDFGSGTGLLLERIAPFVRKISAVDISKSMNAQLARKRDSLRCELDILEIDLASQNLTAKFDVIISSMAMHHVQDTEAMFLKFYDLLNDEGIIAISDLDSEDGSFHTDDMGVHHCGFDREVIAAAARRARFRDVELADASVVQKPQGSFPVFLLTAKR